MKTVKYLLAITLVATLTGCSSMKFTRIDKPITVEGKVYTALLTERVQPWCTSATTLTLVESTGATRPMQGQAVMYQPPVQVLTKTHVQTHVVNSNNQGSAGYAGGVIGNTILGGGMVGAASVLRPARIAGGSSSASSSSAACASSGP